MYDKKSEAREFFGSSRSEAVADAERFFDHAVGVRESGLEPLRHFFDAGARRHELWQRCSLMLALILRQRRLVAGGQSFRPGGGAQRRRAPHERRQRR